MIRDNVVLVTGGGAGLGRALVDRLLAEGARVVVLDRSAERLQALQAEHGSERLRIQHGDVADRAANAAAVEAAVNGFGRLDAFVGNAALWDFSVSLLDLPAEDIDAAFDEVFAVNVKGYLIGAHAAAPALLQSRGCMVFSLSNSALYPGGGGPLYTASKHAALGLVKQLAYELSPEVRVNAVAPTGMPTALTGPRALGQQGRQVGGSVDPQAFAQRVPLGFMPRPEDYLGAYLYLLDRELSPTVTGTVNVCDMGLGVRGMRSVRGGDLR